MAKPYLIFKAHTGIYYAQICLADVSLSNNKFTGCRNRTEAERTVMEWIVTGNIPARVGLKDSKVKSIDKIRLFNDLRTAEFDSDDINNIIKILKERNYLYSAVASTLIVDMFVAVFANSNKAIKDGYDSQIKKYDHELNGYAKETANGKKHSFGASDGEGMGEIND